MMTIVVLLELEKSNIVHIVYICYVRKGDTHTHTHTHTQRERERERERDVRVHTQIHTQTRSLAHARTHILSSHI